MKHISRRTFLLRAGASLSAAATTFGYMRYWESENVEVSQTTIPNGTVALQHPLKVLHLSDLHASAQVSLEYLQRAIEKSLLHNPDLILLTGDFITGTFSQISHYSNILSLLSAAAPTFAVSGNHDGGDWAALAGGYQTLDVIEKLLSLASIPLLHNRAQKVLCAGNTLWLVGVGDIWNNALDAEKAFSSLPEQSTEPVILLSHNPDSKERLAKYPWDIMLSGHTHGGQLVVPFINYRPFLPVRDTRYAEGLNRYDNRWIYTTRGLGNLHGLRFNCPPEASVLLFS